MPNLTSFRLNRPPPTTVERKLHIQLEIAVNGVLKSARTRPGGATTVPLHRLDRLAQIINQLRGLAQP